MAYSKQSPASSGVSHQSRAAYMAPERSFTAYVVEDAKDGGKSVWTRVGKAFENQDSRGFSVLLNELPKHRRIVVRLDLPRERR